VTKFKSADKALSIVLFYHKGLLKFGDRKLVFSRALVIYLSLGILEHFLDQSGGHSLVIRNSLQSIGVHWESGRRLDAAIRAVLHL
jgi:hypothetical protein